MPKLKYLKVKPADFEALCVCSVRYSIGRQTYMPGWICDIVRQHKKLLTDNTLEAIRRDIVNAVSLGDDHIDLPTWVDLKNQITQELVWRNKV